MQIHSHFQIQIKCHKSLLKLYWVKAFCFFVFCSLLSVAAQPTWGQSNFTPMTAQDIEERDEVLVLTPGFKVSGDYRMHVIQIDSNTFPPREPDARDPKALNFEHELNIGFRSSVHRKLSINVELEIRQGPLQEADLREQNASAGRTTDSQTAQIQARQAFLEYNSNPRNIVKIGKHAFNIGDRYGKVFSGILTGVSQDCTVGTWCYELGAAKLGKHPADWLYYGSLDYDLFHEKNTEGATSNRLTIGIFRILYTERDIPLGKSNGPTPKNKAALDRLAKVYAEGSVNQQKQRRTLSKQVVDRQGRPLYYDALKQEYFGMHLKWDTFPFFLRFDLTSNQGNRHYHLLRESGKTLEKPDFGENTKQFKDAQKAKRTLSGVTSELELSYQMDSHQFGFRGMFASGDKEKWDPDNTGVNFLRSLHSYYEMVPGSYQGTNFYFNGDGLGLTGSSGLGHSISNTTLLGGWYRLTLEQYSVNYQTGLFQLTRTQAVRNELGEAVQDIGVEWDNTIFWTVDKKLKTEFELNLFQTGKAFNYKDHQMPLKKNDPVTHLVARILYSF